MLRGALRVTRKQIMWLIVFILLSVVTVLILTNTQDFSYSGFWECCKNADPIYLICAFLTMLGIILFEGLSIRDICGSMGYRRSIMHGVTFCAADLFVSAITPSASGGQPAAAYCMYTDGIPVSVASVALVLNLVLYKAALFTVSLLCLLLRPSMFFGFHTVSKVLVVLGAVIQLLIAVMLLLLLLLPKMTFSIFNWCLNLLIKLHLVRNGAEKQKKLAGMMQNYAECVRVVRNHRGMLLRSMLYNLGQRVCMLLVSVFVFLALGGRAKDCLDVFIAQGYVYLGSNSMPLPGAVGVSDWLFVDVFSSYFTDAVSFNLLARGISFYINIAICALLTWIWLLRHKGASAPAAD